MSVLLSPCFCEPTTKCTKKCLVASGNSSSLTFPPVYLMEDNLNGRLFQWKTTSMIDNLIGRQPQWKTTTMEDNHTTKEDNLNYYVLFQTFCSSTTPTSFNYRGSTSLSLSLTNCKNATL